MEREHEDNVRHQLDEDFDVLRDLIYAPDPSSTGSNSVPLGLRRGADAQPTVLTLPVQSEDYDQHVRELAFEKRAKPKDRTKTEEEIALKEKETLEKAERQRQRRMLGLEESDSEDDGKGSRKKRKRGADDLEDDFVDEEDQWDGLGAGLGQDINGRNQELDLEDDNGNDDDDGNEQGEDDEDEESGPDDVDDGDEWSSDPESYSEAEAGKHEDLVLAPESTQLKPKKKEVATKELPFTFPCPSTHEEFLSIVDDVDEKDVPTVVKRIQTLYHTSLSPENKFKLQVTQNLSSILSGAYVW